MKKLLMTKIQASAIHLGISLLIFLGILYVIAVHWYPEPFFSAGGGWKGIKIMAAVDLVLGPTLTFIIYNYKKSRKEITLDLSIIALVQVSALIWGGVQVYGERPVALAMWEGEFYTVTEDYLSKQGADLQDLDAFSDDIPKIVYAKNNHSVEQLEEIQRLNKLKIPPYAQVHLYVSIHDVFSEILPYELPGSLLTEYLDGVKPTPDQHVFSGKAKRMDLLVVLDDSGGLESIKPIKKPRQ